MELVASYLGLASNAERMKAFDAERVRFEKDPLVALDKRLRKMYELIPACDTSTTSSELEERSRCTFDPTVRLAVRWVFALPDLCLAVGDVPQVKRIRNLLKDWGDPDDRSIHEISSLLGVIRGVTQEASASLASRAETYTFFRGDFDAGTEFYARCLDSDSYYRELEDFLFVATHGSVRLVAATFAAMREEYEKSAGDWGRTYDESFSHFVFAFAEYREKSKKRDVRE